MTLFTVSHWLATHNLLISTMTVLMAATLGEKRCH